jgi:uncharacterized protein (UPF0332 family)
MKDKDITELIKKARLSLSAARELLKGGYPDFSASRAYYAMFYATEAVLLTRGLSFSSHKSVISNFGKEFIKPGLMPSNLHRYILDAFDIRHTGDYGPIASVSEEKAKMVIEQTEEFIEEIERYLTKEGYIL